MGGIQAKLNFAGCTNPQFANTTGLGRIAVAACALGLVFGVHATVLCYQLALHGVAATLVVAWSLYMISLSLFHFSEFFTTVMTKPESATYDSFVLNHSTEYTYAVLGSWVEFWLEAWLSPGLKQRPRLMLAGVAVAALGQAARALAMWTAGRHFSHQIMLEREKGHALVTHGIYRWLRHPSYFGWFWWCAGSQLLLANPLCLVAYVGAAWMFFRRRIPFEEELLHSFYRDAYSSYAARTYIGIPWVLAGLPVAAGAPGSSRSNGRISGGGGGSGGGSGGGGGGNDGAPGSRSGRSGSDS